MVETCERKIVWIFLLNVQLHRVAHRVRYQVLIHIAEDMRDVKGQSKNLANKKQRGLRPMK